MSEFVASVYHRLTSYHADRHWLIPADDPRVLATFLAMDAEHRPADFKTYPPHLPRLRLPSPDLPRPPGPTGEALDLTGLSRLLHHSAGVLRRRSRQGRDVYYRATPSAGNRHPLELYVCARDLPGLDDGSWHYDPRAHELCLIGPPARCAGSAVILTGIPWRSCWKYAERGYRHMWWDAGSLAAQLHEAAAERGLRARIRLRFADADIAALVGADGQHELPLAIVHLGDGTNEPAPSGRAVPGDIGPIPTVFPVVDAVHRAGSAHAEANVSRWPAGSAGDLAPSRTVTEELASLVARRGSTRRFAPDKPVPGDELRRMLSAAAVAPEWDSGPWFLSQRVMVHNAERVPRGLYLLQPPELTPIARRDFRAEAVALCGNQKAAGEAGIVVCQLARLEQVLSEQGERGYRAAQFAAGFALGRLYLGAVARNLGCTGLVMTDDLAPATLATADTALLACAIGVPVTA